MNEFIEKHSVPRALCVDSVLSTGGTKNTQGLSPRIFHTGRRKRWPLMGKRMWAMLASVQQGNELGGDKVGDGCGIEKICRGQGNNLLVLSFHVHLDEVLGRWWGVGSRRPRKNSWTCLWCKKAILWKHRDRTVGRKNCTGVVKSDRLYAMELGGQVKREVSRGTVICERGLLRYQRPCYCQAKVVFPSSKALRQ